MSFRILLAGLALSVVCAPAESATIYRTHLSHGVANCQPALPAFDGNIRKRPKGIGNEGTSAAFVTCDFEHLPNALNSVSWAIVYARNNGAASAEFTCTLVQAFGATSYGANVVKTATIAAGGSGDIGFGASDNGGDALTLPAISCKLSPGVEIYGTALAFFEEIGN